MEVRSGGYEKGEATFNGGPLLAQTGVVAPYSGGGVGAQHVALHSRNIGPSICLTRLFVSVGLPTTNGFLS